MARSRADVGTTSTSVPPNELTGPQLYLSSAQVGWEGLSVQVFHEPNEMESWHAPATREITLMALIEGGVYVERRQTHDPWKGEVMRSGDLSLRWEGEPAYEARWWSLSSLPLQTLYLSLSRELVTRVAEEVAGVDLASLEGVRSATFRDPLLSQIAFVLRRELEQPAPAGKLYAQSAAQMLALHLVRQYTSGSRLGTVPTPPKGLTDRQVREVLAFIQTHLSEDLSLDTLAEQIGFSPYHFARLFRKATGTSLHQAVLRQRVEHAQWLLQETRLPLAQVAETCGFAHQSHLTQVFKQYLGCTPRIYRRDDSMIEFSPIQKSRARPEH